MNIAIIGAGVVGVSTAYYLHKQGHNVTIYESLPISGLETSYANAGLLTPSLCDPWNAPGIAWSFLKTMGSEDSPIRIRANVIPSLVTWGVQFIRYSASSHYNKNFKKNVLLANYSLQLMNDLIKELNFNFLYQKSGTLKIFRDKKSYLQLQKFKKLSSQLNISSVLLDANETIAKEPALLPIENELLGSLYYENDAFGDAFLFTQYLAKYLESDGVHFFYNSQVRLISDSHDNCLLKTNTNEIKFDCIVLAAGTASPNLVQELGIRLPIQPLKGYSVTVGCNEWEAKPHIPVIDHERHVAITPLGDRIRIAGTAELAGFDKTLTSKPIEKLKQLLLKIYPQSKEYFNKDSISCWAGLRPTSVDGVPFITPTKYKNLYINSGHGHLGWTLALGSGKILSDLVSGNTPLLEMKEYNLERS